MNTRHFFPPDSLCNSGNAVSFSSNLPTGEHGMTVGARHTPARAPPTSFLVRMAMRISRARWFSFLRRVFHYQNGSRSDLGSNPFNSSAWMLMEFTALVVQVSTTTFTLAISKKEKPVWPMRIWIVGYDIGCVLSLLLLYGRYRHLHLTQGEGFSLSDMEQQRNSEESRYLLRQYPSPLMILISSKTKSSVLSTPCITRDSFSDGNYYNFSEVEIIMTRKFAKN